MSITGGVSGLLNIRIDGDEELSKLLQNLPDEAKDAAKAELKRVTTDLKSNAVELAPVDQGDLRGSAFDEVGESGGSLEGVVAFDTPYATRQHEELSYNHPKGGQAKYLEQPFKQNVAKYIKRIGDAIKKAVDKP